MTAQMRSMLPRLTRSCLHGSQRAKPAALSAFRASSYPSLGIRSLSDKPSNTFEDEPERKWSTPLAKQLAKAIEVSYMHILVRLMAELEKLLS
jgi:NADH dehydrogenase [ubiquinone] 1 alpha subcomplex assembly factor 7